MEAIIALLSFIVAIIFLVGIHELGHYIAARSCGVQVKVFAIGFGWKLYSYKDRRGTSWELRAIPLGGFVAWDSLGKPLDHEERQKIPRHLYDSKSPLQRAWIALAGPLANILFGFVAFFGLALFLSGGPTAVVKQVEPNSIARMLEMKPGMTLISVQGYSPDLSEFELIDVYEQQADGRYILPNNFEVVVLNEDQQRQSLHLNLQDLSHKNPGLSVLQLGLRFERNPPSISLGSIIQSADYAGELLLLSIKAVGKVIVSLFDWTDQGSQTRESLGGPVTIANYAGEVVQQSWVEALYFVAFLSYNIALFNLLPLGFLDGGRLLMIGFEALPKSLRLQRLQQSFFIVGMLILVMLLYFALSNDLWSLLRVVFS